METAYCILLPGQVFFRFHLLNVLLLLRYLQELTRHLSEQLSWLPMALHLHLCHSPCTRLNLSSVLLWRRICLLSPLHLVQKKTLRDHQAHVRVLSQKYRFVNLGGYFPWIYMGFQVLTGGSFLIYVIGLLMGHLYITIKDIYLPRYHKDYLPTPRFL